MNKKASNQKSPQIRVKKVDKKVRGFFFQPHISLIRNCESSKFCIKLIKNYCTPVEKDVFQYFLKRSKVSHKGTFFGKEFQREGANTERNRQHYYGIVLCSLV